MSDYVSPAPVTPDSSWDTHNVWEADIGCTNCELEEYGLQDWEYSSDAGNEEIDPEAVQYECVNQSLEEEDPEEDLESGSNGSSGESDSEEEGIDPAWNEDQEEISINPFKGVAYSSDREPEEYSPISYNNESVNSRAPSYEPIDEY